MHELIYNNKHVISRGYDTLSESCLQYEKGKEEEINQTKLWHVSHHTPCNKTGLDQANPEEVGEESGL